MRKRDKAMAPTGNLFPDGQICFQVSIHRDRIYHMMYIKIIKQLSHQSWERVFLFFVLKNKSYIFYPQKGSHENVFPLRQQRVSHFLAQFDSIIICAEYFRSEIESLTVAPDCFSTWSTSSSRSSSSSSSLFSSFSEETIRFSWLGSKLLTLYRITSSIKQ